MPAVLSVTMAVGALLLSKKKVIVSRLEAIEEMAGMNILCSDKNGTLTKNELTLGTSVLFAAQDEARLLHMAALASRENGDAIDNAILHKLSETGHLSEYKVEHFTPFDPVSKRSEVLVLDKQGNEKRITKEVPQVVAKLSNLTGKELELLQHKVEENALRGLRTLGVAELDSGGHWQVLGLLTLYDPPGRMLRLRSTRRLVTVFR